MLEAKLAAAEMDDELEEPDKSCTSYRDSCELAMFTCTMLEVDKLAGVCGVFSSVTTLG